MQAAVDHILSDADGHFIYEATEQVDTNSKALW